MSFFLCLKELLNELLGPDEPSTMSIKSLLELDTEYYFSFSKETANNSEGLSYVDII